MGSKLGFFFREDFTLINYTTTKIDVEKKKSKLPKDQPKVEFDIIFFSLNNKLKTMLNY